MIHPAVTHAMIGLGGVASPRIVATEGRGRHRIEAGDVAVATLVVPTGSAWFRIEDREGTSLAVVHSHEPFGRTVIRDLDADPLLALEAVGARCRGAVLLDDGRWSASPGAATRRRSIADALDAACTACMARDPDLDYVEAMLEWDGDDPLVSFASSGTMQAPTPSASLIGLLHGIGFVETIAAARTWQVVGGIMGGTAPTWDDPDGIVFDRGDSVSYDVSDVVGRMRAIRSGSDAATRLGVDARLLVE